MRSFLVLAGVAAALLASDHKLGKPLTLKEQVPIAALVTEPARYAGKTVQVKGTVREVCRHMGCWMEIADQAGDKAVRIKVKDGEIVFPETAVGKTAVAEGRFTRIGDEKAGYQIQGTGAVILE
jgi:hypothetical protein